jgi:hypothetical protein
MMVNNELKKECGKCRGLILRYYSGIVLEGRKKTTATLEIIGGPTEIGIELLTNGSRKLPPLEPEELLSREIF